ncbi:MAG: DUF4340 domain-containing protein [Candidatus Loosdrechtia sp.]|uniref:DUF4340 domain-containing protein n=1 Tax=Candidatus Loosdrechtia sp. TaxID=3101272 RepID=UPI003A73F394|nr:MAG: DUF4340 domain-containing protein [Candidatus Jettenia sp. AMX2]
MKLKTTIILLFVAIIGISYVFLYEKEQMPHEEWEKLQKKVIPDFKASLVTKIELNNEWGRIFLEKDENNFWYIVEPKRLRADNSEINSILSEFEYMNKVGAFKQEGSKPFDLEDYGLDAPKVSITMYTNIPAKRDKIQITGPKDKYTVFVGQKLAAGDNVYIKLDTNDEVVVVPGTLKDKINKHILELRSKWVFSFDKDAVDGLQIKTDEFNIVCSKKGIFWRIDDPVKDLADLEKIKDMLGKFKNLQIERTDFLPEEEEENLAKYGLETPRYTVTIKEKDITQSVVFGYSLDNKVYAKRTDEPTIFLLKDAILIDLSKKPNGLRDRKVVRFDSIGTYGINKLEIKTASDVITIEKSLDLDWIITKPINIYADQDTVKNFIEKIKTLEIEDFISDKPVDLAMYGLKEPVFEISVTKEEDRELAKFYVGKKLPEGNKCYVKRVGEEPVYTVPMIEFYDKLEATLLSFRDRLVCDFDKDLAKKIVIEKPDRTFVCKITNKRDIEGQMAWELSNPVQTIADAETVNQIIWDLSFLKAEKYVTEAPQDLESFGLNNPAIKVTVTYEKDAADVPEGQNKKKDNTSGSELALQPQEPLTETRTLLIGKNVKEGDRVNFYAMFNDSNFVFELPWPKVRDFDAELVPTKIFDFERSEVVTLTLDYSDRSIQLEKINNVWNWKTQAPDQKNIQGKEVDYYIRSLSELKSSYIEQYKPTDLTQFSLDKPQLTITAGLETGDIVLLIGKKKNGQGYYAKSKNSDYIHVIDNETITKLMKTEEGFTTIVDEMADKALLEALKPVPEKNPYGSPHGRSYGAPHGGGFH